MTTCTCTHTDLCPHCREQVLKDLRVVAGLGDWEGSPLIDELEVTITRQNVMPAMKIDTKGTKDRQPILFHLAASEAAKGLRWAMLTARQCMIHEYPHLNPPSLSATGIAKWLLLVPDLFRNHPQAIMMISKIRLAVYTGVQVIDSPPEMAWLGFCGECGRLLQIVMESGDTFDDRLVRCCGESTSVRELRARLLHRLSSAVIPASDALGLVHSFTGEAVTSPEYFRKKLKKNLTQPVPGKYRAMDVLMLHNPVMVQRYLPGVPVTEDTDTGD